MRFKSIVRLREDSAVTLAAAELRRCLQQATGTTFRVSQPRNAGPRSLALGLFSDFPDLSSTGYRDHATNDEYDIRVSDQGGRIAASNPRSVLLGAYRYLTELGCRWVRPGKGGENIPSLARELPTVGVRDSASYRHRAVCIEGAVSEENVLDMVDWMPKLGFNGYFIQFREAFEFYQRWYEHMGNPTLPGKPFKVETARKLTQRLRAEIRRRGLQLHMVGHGWTCEPFGMPGSGWARHDGPVPAEAVPHLAEVHGKRELWGGIALNTNLCYGNPETRGRVTDDIVKWSRQNPDVDIIHFWLADGSNNHCECPKCRDHRPADLYVRMLNELDAKLTAAGLPARIVFLIYVDLLWPPEAETIKSPDRFLLMFAPITRSYSTPFAAGGASAADLPPYVRNRLSFPREPGMNVAFLRAWQRMFKGDSFDFDYHFMWDHHRDPGQFTHAQVLHQDCRNLRDIGLDGLVSCQNQRVFFPSGLGMTVMGRTLWNRDLGFAEIAEDYFASAFGREWKAAREFLERMSILFQPVLLRGEGDEALKRSAPGSLAKVADAVRAFRPVVEREAAGLCGCQALSWAYLAHHLDFCLLFADALAAHYEGRADQAKTRARTLFGWAREHEMTLQPVLDVFEFQQTLAPLFGMSPAEI